MRVIPFFLLFVGVSSNIIAQFGEQQIISTDIDFPTRAIPLDIDGDEDLDILVTGNDECQLCWLENLDGNGNFSNPINIDINPILFIDIQHIDLDGDNDKDIIYIENNPRALKWLENLDGLGEFSPPELILEEDFIQQFIFNDLDNDGDNDLILSFTDTFTDWISWLENVDGQGNFGNEIALIQNIDRLSNLIITDVDNDGFDDILTANENNGPAQILYYKNTENQTFDNGNTIFQFQFAQSDLTSIFDINYIDITNNGLEDIIFNTVNDDVGNFLSMIPALEENGVFGEQINLLTSNRTILTGDIDNDNDNDLLIPQFNGDAVLFYEFDESLDLTNESIVTSDIDNLRDFHLADIDNDGLLDLITASIGDDKVAWYTNSILGINDVVIANKITASPNPVRNILTLDSVFSIESTSLVNGVGQQFKMEVTSNQIDFSGLSKGIYFLEIEDAQNQRKEVLKIVKN